MNKWLKGALVAVIFAGAFLVDRWNSYNSPADQLFKALWVEQVTSDLSLIAKMSFCGDDMVSWIAPQMCNELMLKLKQETRR
jgi:hypothetical protein